MRVLLEILDKVRDLGGVVERRLPMEAVFYSVLGLVYLAQVSIVYPSFWLGAISLILYLGWVFRVEAFRFIPILAVPYGMLSLQAEGGYILLTIVCSLVFFCWGGFSKPEDNLRMYLDKGRRAFCPSLFIVHLLIMFVFIGAANAFKLHQNIQTHDFDLGVFDNIFFNMMEGGGMYNPLERDEDAGSHFKVHFSPSLYLLLPAYSLFPRAETLQFLQLGAVGGAGVVLYFLVAKLCNKPTGCVVGGAWIFYTPILGGAFYDFHELCLGPLLLFSVGLSLAYGFTILPWVLALLTLGVKEDFSLFVVPAFIFLGAWTGRKWMGVALGVFGLFFFAGVRVFWILPYGENWFHIYGRVEAGSFSELVEMSLTQPWTVIEATMASPSALTALELLVPLCFLPLFSRWTYALVFLPVLALFPGADAMRTNYYQYTFLIAPMLFLGLGHLLSQNRNNRGWRISLLIMIVFTQLYGGLFSTDGFRSGFNQVIIPVQKNSEDRFGEVNLLKNIVPEEATLATPPEIASHFSNRRVCYTTKYWTQENFLTRSPDRLPSYLITTIDSHLDPRPLYTVGNEGRHFLLWQKK